MLRLLCQNNKAERRTCSTAACLSQCSGGRWRVVNLLRGPPFKVCVLPFLWGGLLLRGV